MKEMDKGMGVLVYDIKTKTFINNQPTFQYELKSFIFVFRNTSKVMDHGQSYSNSRNLIPINFMSNKNEETKAGSKNLINTMLSHNFLQCGSYKIDEEKDDLYEGTSTQKHDESILNQDLHESNGLNVKHFKVKKRNFKQSKR